MRESFIPQETCFYRCSFTLSLLCLSSRGTVKTTPPCCAASCWALVWTHTCVSAPKLRQCHTPGFWPAVMMESSRFGRAWLHTGLFLFLQNNVLQTSQSLLVHNLSHLLWPFTDLLKMMFVAYNGEEMESPKSQMWIILFSRVENLSHNWTHCLFLNLIKLQMAMCPWNVPYYYLFQNIATFSKSEWISFSLAFTAQRSPLSNSTEQKNVDFQPTLRLDFYEKCAEYLNF